MGFLLLLLLCQAYHPAMPIPSPAPNRRTSTGSAGCSSHALFLGGFWVGGGVVDDCGDDDGGGVFCGGAWVWGMSDAGDGQCVAGIPQHVPEVQL